MDTQFPPDKTEKLIPEDVFLVKLDKCLHATVTSVDICQILFKNIN